MNKAKFSLLLEKRNRCRNPRAGDHWVVTEYGYIDFTGLSLQERVKAIINIAHSDDRKMLSKAAIERNNGLKI